MSDLSGRCGSIPVTSLHTPSTFMAKRSRSWWRRPFPGAPRCVTVSCHSHPTTWSPMIDRLPPQSIEAEQSVLGAVLIDRETIIEIAEFLRPEDFYRQPHATVYRAMLELFERREPVDLVTVAETLERKDELD